MRTRIHIRKERLKFSAAHMTVFSDGTKENLHGHNYETELLIESDESIPFSEFKSVLHEILEPLDEVVLLAEKNARFKIKKRSSDSIEFSLCEKNYVLPSDEVVLLDTDNITAETLSKLILESFLEALPAKTKSSLVSVEMRVDETPGQGATTSWKRQSVS